MPLKKKIDYTEVQGDYTPESGMKATAEAMEHAVKPTAIVYDNDLMAIAGCRQLEMMGYDVPGDVSVVAWDDSFECRISLPSITAIDHDLLGSSAEAADLLMKVVAGKRVASSKNELWTMVKRQSTARVNSAL